MGEALLIRAEWAASIDVEKPKADENRSSVAADRRGNVAGGSSLRDDDREIAFARWMARRRDCAHGSPEPTAKAGDRQLPDDDAGPEIPVLDHRWV